VKLGDMRREKKEKKKEKKFDHEGERSAKKKTEDKRKESKKRKCFSPNDVTILKGKVGHPWGEFGTSSMSLGEIKEKTKSHYCGNAGAVV